MAYTKTVWKDYPDTTTKMTAQKLNNLEDGIEALDTGKVNKTDIADNLTTNDATKTLSAKQGKALNDKVQQICFASSLGGTVAAGETKYIGYGVAGDAFSSALVMSRAGTIKNLYLYSIGGAPGVGQTYTATMMLNNVAQTLTCTISGTATNKGSDTTNSFTVLADQRISLRIVASGGATTSAFTLGFTFIPS